MTAQPSPASFAIGAEKIKKAKSVASNSQAKKILKLERQIKKMEKRIGELTVQINAAGRCFTEMTAFLRQMARYDADAHQRFRATCVCTPARGDVFREAAYAARRASLRRASPQAS